MTLIVVIGHNCIRRVGDANHRHRPKFKVNAVVAVASIAQPVSEASRFGWNLRRPLRARRPQVLSHADLGLQRVRTSDASGAALNEGGVYGFVMAAEASYRQLTRVPGVRSGAAIVVNTRIGVHDVVGLVVSGASVDDVVRSLPELTRAQVYACLAYYEDHRAAVD